MKLKKKPYRPWSAPPRRPGNGSLPFAATSIDWKKAPRRGTKHHGVEEKEKDNETLQLIKNRTALRHKRSDRRRPQSSKRLKRLDDDPPYAEFAMKRRAEARRKARARQRFKGAIGKIKMLNFAARATAGAWWEQADDVVDGEDDHLWALAPKHRRDKKHQKLLRLSLMERRERTATPAKKYESERIVREQTKIVRAGNVARGKLDARERKRSGAWRGKEYPKRGGADKALSNVQAGLAMAVDAEKRKGWTVGGRRTTLADRLASAHIGGGGKKENDAVQAAKAANARQHLYSGKWGESGMAGRSNNPLCMRCGRNRAGFPVSACGHRPLCAACKSHIVDADTGNALTTQPCIICTANAFSLSTGRDAWLFFRDA